MKQCHLFVLLLHALETHEVFLFFFVNKVFFKQTRICKFVSEKEILGPMHVLYIVQIHQQMSCPETFFLWGYIQDNVHRILVTSVNCLKITIEIANIYVDVLKLAWKELNYSLDILNLFFFLKKPIVYK